MFSITINEKGGPSRQESFDKSEITIGRVQGNDVILPKGNISKRHSRIVLKDGKFIIVDLKSTNGTYVNGKKITAPQVIKSTDKIYIGDFTLQLGTNGAAISPQPDLPREQSGLRSGASRVDPVSDAFGMDAAPEVPAARSAPGLIDENFDQEFEGGEPIARGLPRSPRRMDAPPPPEPPVDVEPELSGPPQEPDPMEDPQRGSVLPIRPKRAAARPTPSRVRPLSGRRGLTGESLDHGTEMDGEGAGRALSRPQSTAHPTPLSPMSMSPSLLVRDAMKVMHCSIVEELGLRGLEISQVLRERDRVQEAAEILVASFQMSGRLDPSTDPRGFVDALVRRVTDFDAIAELVADETVDEIAVTHDRRVWAEREGRLEPTSQTLDREEDVVGLIERIAVLGGFDLVTRSHLIDVRLKDGARFTASLPPIAFRGPTFSYRKPTREAFTLQRLLEYSTISSAMMTFIDYCVRYEKSILLALGPGVSASATLNALAAQMLEDERIVTIERGIELHLAALRNVTALQPKADTPLTALIRHAVHLQPDRVIIGDITGAASDVVSAFAGPLEGSIAAYSASSPEQALDRIAGLELSQAFPDRAVARRYVAAAFPIILQERRFQDHSRRITEISEVVTDAVGDVKVNDIFRFKPEGVDENGILTGSFAPTGHVPRFLEELADRGDAVDLELFK